ERLVKNLENQSCSTEVMAQFALLWQKVEKLEEQAEKERSEKEQLRRANAMLQH
ncbi:unnamed protein product, partial [Effrenium voratum]